MITKKILLSALMLGAINSFGLAMNINEPSSPLEKTADNPTTHYTSNPNRLTACSINQEYIIFIEKIKKENGSCFGAGPLMLSNINDVFKGQLQEPISAEELFSLDFIAKMTSSDCYCNRLCIFRREKGDPKKLYELLQEIEDNIITQ